MNIAVAGYGVEGKASYKYFTGHGHTVTILDERTQIPGLPVDAKTVLGERAFSDMASFDMVIRTPSLSPSTLYAAKKLWSATNEFFAHCPAPIIGVTGTKGKGTTASLIASILKAAGKTVYLVGNIGQPALEILDKVRPEDIVVYELSSFQLWDIEKSPSTAVVLMIEPDHLDIHSSFEEYVQAKQNIVRRQNEHDRVIFNNKNTYSLTIGESSRAIQIPVQAHNTAHALDGYFYYGDQKICPITSLKLPGVHNLDNACAAIAAIWPYVQDGTLIASGLAAFSGLDHRLKFVKDVDGVKYYDDSIATTIGSAIAAINAFQEQKIIILGGSSKGVADFEEVAATAEKHQVKAAILIGEQAPIIQKALEKHAVPYKNMGNSVSMADVVKEARRLATSGDVVILSPACASYDMFKGYSDRGDQFVQAVKEL